jgi:hypothetical protein
VLAPQMPIAATKSQQAAVGCAPARQGAQDGLHRI